MGHMGSRSLGGGEESDTAGADTHQERHLLQSQEEGDSGSVPSSQLLDGAGKALTYCSKTRRKRDE